MRFELRRDFVVGLLLVVSLGGGFLAKAVACPFCSAVGQTFTQEIEALDAALIVESVDLKEMPGPEDDGELPKSVFKVLEVLKGEKWAKVDETIETHYFGERKEGTFLVFGADAPDILWTSPIRMNERSIGYLKELMTLPAKGPDRLKFFQGYLEDKDEMLSQDAYDEFARAPYEAVVALKPHMKREEIVAWIKDVKNVPASRRRLYLTMLGVCGEAKDAGLLEEFMRSDSLEDKLGLDAMVACYLTLRGEEGMGLVKELFLSNKEAEYSHTYSAIMALRFHASETDVISRDGILSGLRSILEREDLADLVIPDLARMEDWDSLPRLVELFRAAKPGESWARVPIINYVRACPLPEADTALDTLREIDPAAVKRASTFFPFAPKGKKKPAKTNEDAAASVDTLNNDVPAETVVNRTVSAEIALPDVGEPDEEQVAAFPSADEYADTVRTTDLAESTATPSLLRRFAPIGALAIAGLILISFVLPRRESASEQSAS